jgi:NAD(P)H dehydrogenase (quinone)
MRIAVTGATGTLGGQVVRLLAAHSGHEVVAVSRRRPSDLPPRARSARADYADLAALRRAFAGADTLVFVSSDGEAVNVLYHHQNVIRAAADATVGHIVAMSGLDADITSPFCYAVTYGHTERLLHECRCDVTIVRTSIFTEFFLQFLRTARERGQIRLPAEDGRVSLLSIADTGRCLAALALREPTRRVHELTGPAALNMHDVAAAAARVWRTPVSYVAISAADFQRELAADDLDPWWCYAFSSMFASIRQHRWEAVTDQVLRVSNRQPLQLRDLLAPQS